MTPAKLQAISDVDTWVHRQAEKPQAARPKPKPSANPYADLTALANL